MALTSSKYTMTKIFFIDRGIKVATARRFVENIGKWVENWKKAVAMYDILQTGSDSF
jgi:hypothetical protein